MACGQGSLEIVKLLASHDLTICRITLIDSEGQTPLHRAAANNHVTVVEYLLDQVNTTSFMLLPFYALVLFVCLFVLSFRDVIPTLFGPFNLILVVSTHLLYSILYI